MASARGRVEEVVPAAGRTVHSLRDIGYELPQAVADLVDNSIEASATEVRVDLVFAGEESWIRVADNGIGMDTGTITESLRIGSIRDYGDDDLGKFGFGLKTASISQCRRVVVASRISPQRARVEARVFDLDHIERTNRWEILVLAPEDRSPHLVQPLQETPGTVVLWENLDRVLTYKDPDGVWAKKKMLAEAENVAQHLGMVFHRFLAGKARGRRKVRIFVNDARVEAWDPYCQDEPATDSWEPSHYEVVSEGNRGIVSLHPYVLPGQAEFSDIIAWNRASGMNKWNNQQGLYIYRADRLIQWGGWNRMRTNDEHTKLARVSLDFTPDLDAAFGINISKAIVKLPPELRDAIQPEIRRVCTAADDRYRRSSRPKSPPAAPRSGPPVPPGRPAPHQPPSGLPPLAPASSPAKARSALLQAAAEVGETDALERIMTKLRRKSPEVARALGW